MTPRAATGGADGPLVTLDGISKRFGYREALRDVDLELPRGQCTAIFGSNGAGKSTLVRIITTQWAPSSGQGRVLGADLRREAKSIRRRVGVVFHQSFLRPELTLEENIRFFGEMYGVRPSSRAEGLLRTLGLSHRSRDRVGTYSEGMTKRADLLRSLLHDPELWILDEPFSGLDPSGRDLLESMVRDFLSVGGSVILVTHDVEVGRRLGDITVRLEAGEIVERKGRGELAPEVEAGTPGAIE